MRDGLINLSRETAVMKDSTTLTEYGAPIDAQAMVTPPDVTERGVEALAPLLGR